MKRISDDKLLQCKRGILNKYYPHAFTETIKRLTTLEESDRAIAQAQLESCEKQHAEEMAMQEGYMEQAKQAVIRALFEGIEKGLSDIYATTVNPNPTFQDGSQEHSYMARMYALEKMIAKVGQSLKDKYLKEE